MVWLLLWVVAQSAFFTQTFAYVPPLSVFVKARASSIKSESLKNYQQRSPSRSSQIFVIDDRLPDDELSNISGSSQRTDNMNLAIAGAVSDSEFRDQYRVYKSANYGFEYHGLLVRL